jgi:transmembrane sensor
MSSDATPPISADIIDQASTWFVDFRLNEVDAQGRERFIEWLRLSPQHIRAYLEVAGTYTDMAAPGQALALDVERWIAAARADASVVPLKALPTPPRASTARDQPARSRFPRMRLAIAAGLVAAIVGALGIWRWQIEESYATRIGEQRSFMLSDGSRIDLNARSKVRVRMGSARREIELVRGQAFFQVAKNPNRPFIVRAADATIRAVGTSFDVNRARSGTTVTVLEGRVAVQSPAPRNAERADAPEATREPQPPEELFLSAGQQVQLSSVKAPVPRAANVAAAKAWTQRHLVFDGTPLQDVVEEFNRYNTRQLVVDDRALDTFLISGYYATPDPASLLAFLRSERSIRVIERDDEVHITRQ